MKCQNCGNNLNIEQAFCPYCGSKNEQAAKHNEDMNRYNKAFEQTQKNVLENSRHFRAFTVKCTIIAVLAFLIVLTIVGIQSDYAIKSFFLERNAIKNKAKITAQLDEYEENREYFLMYEYLTTNRLEYSDTFKEYSSIYNATSAYRLYLNQLNRLLDDEVYGEDRSSEYIANMSNCFKRINNAMVDDSYKQRYGMLSDNHMAFLEDMKAEMQDVTQAYFNLTDEEAAGIWDMTDARRTVLFEEGYKNE